MKLNRSFKRSKTGLLSLCVAAATAGVPFVYAQDDNQIAEEVIVTGYRGSLLNSTIAKRNSVGFSDEIFSDDIGKLPSQNLAESLNRIPGVKIGREVTGEGLQIAVRGLGPSFTKVALNGNNIAIASDGSLDAGNRNREVDLGLFPTELFTQLSVAKSAEANQLEGGISGYVNMRTARAFDSDKRRINFSVEGAYTEINDEISPRASFIYSDIFADDKFGLLVGITNSQNKSRVDGYETIGYTDGCLVDVGGDGSYNCQGNMIGRNQIHWNPVATPDYAATHPGVSAGDPIDLLDVSGASATELDHGIVPYLGRAALVEGDRDTTTGLVSLEYRPSEDMSFVLDVMKSDGDREFNRIDMMLWIRRATGPQNAPIPENFVIDGNEVLRSATLYNTQFWMEARDYTEEVDFESIMPSFSWQINDRLIMDVSASVTESNFRREMPTWLFTTPKGISTYELPSGNNVPSFSFTVPGSSFDLNGTSGWDWGGGGGGDGARFNIDVRETETKGLHLDFGYGEAPEENGLKFGLAYDESNRFMETFGNGAAHNTAVQALDVNDYLYGMRDNFGDTMDGNLGYRRFVQLDYDAIKRDYDYASIVAGATRGGGDAFGATVGDIEETYTAVYGEANASTDNVRVKAGVRFVETEQIMGSYNVNTDTTVRSESTYNVLLPTFSGVYNLSDDINLRASFSRTMTRANPADMFPNAAWSSSGIDTARAGNPNLDPFFSNNVDLGGEWYFSEIGYVGVSVFQKNITGFTYQDNQPVVFENLDELGLDTTNISADQQAQLAACGGPSVCTVTVTTRLNVNDSATLTGTELIWVQPLDMWVEGLGFNASLTKIDQDADNPLAEITGISDWTYNFTGYYENDDFQIRLTYFHQDDAIVSGFVDGNYDGNPLPARRLIGLARSQVDLAASYTLPFTIGNDGELTLTFDAYNMTNEPVGSWYGYDGVPNAIYYPGATYTFGIRGTF